MKVSKKRLQSSLEGTLIHHRLPPSVCFSTSISDSYVLLSKLTSSHLHRCHTWYFPVCSSLQLSRLHKRTHLTNPWEVPQTSVPCYSELDPRMPMDWKQHTKLTTAWVSNRHLSMRVERHLRLIEIKIRGADIRIGTVPSRRKTLSFWLCITGSAVQKWFAPIAEILRRRAHFLARIKEVSEISIFDKNSLLKK